MNCRVCISWGKEIHTCGFAGVGAVVFAGGDDRIFTIASTSTAATVAAPTFVMASTVAAPTFVIASTVASTTTAAVPATVASTTAAIPATRTSTSAVAPAAFPKSATVPPSSTSITATVVSSLATAPIASTALAIPITVSTSIAPTLSVPSIASPIISTIALPIASTVSTAVASFLAPTEMVAEPIELLNASYRARKCLAGTGACPSLADCVFDHLHRSLSVELGRFSGILRPLSLVRLILIGLIQIITAEAIDKSSGGFRISRSSRGNGILRIKDDEDASNKGRTPCPRVHGV
ncbi:hypothetical protein KP509_01G082800 [Ceratopteris richardii]|uniref:Uncharacterized protein n=1 Tax=Ceratopteris richardii TaxID=49495 RepID=A0A8T2VIN8_CERRI|nr:hypothetical protein KP509_01G082800 [Ceratopteris richardii]